jgi:putative MATE family efflux protein
MVQTKFVGELGPDAVAAVGIGQRVFFGLQAVMMAVSAGTTALVARAWGAGDKVEAGRVTMASLALATVFGLLLTVPGILFARPVASIFGLSPETVDLAAEYIIWLSIFNVAFGLNFIIGAGLRAAGDAWSPLWLGIGINILNLGLLYGFVFGAWGFPEMGAPGTAVAGGVSFAVGGVLTAALWFKQVFRLRYVASGWARPDRFLRLLHIGYPAAVEMIIFQIGFFFFFMLMGNYYGTEAFAAYSVGSNVLSVCMVIGFGFSIAGSTLVGQHLGAGDPDGAARSGWRAMGYAVAAMATIGWSMAFFAEELAHFFLTDAPLTIELTTYMIVILGIAMPLLAAEFALGGALRGAGDTRFPLIATFIGLIGVRCTLTALFTFLGWPVVWVYATLLGEYLVKATMLTLRFRSGRWKHVIPHSVPHAP